MPTPDLFVHALAFLVALLLSLVSSTAGVTGAFLLVPFQVSVLGLGTPSVSATNHLYNVFAAPGAFSGYHGQSRILWPLAAVLAVGTLPGILAGVYLRVRYLPDPRLFRPFVGAVLVLLGLVVAARAWARSNTFGDDGAANGRLRVIEVNWRRLRYRFGERTHSLALPGAWLFSLAIGVVGGAYGVGGGVFTSAYLIGACGLPVYTTAGATLLATFAASCAGVAGFTLAAWTGGTGAPPVAPDWSLALAMGLGGLIGGRAGARVQRCLPSRLISAALALLTLILGIGYILRP
jgi:uncharacterized membrane protein YfcA